MDHIESDALYELADVCAKNSFFQFRGKLYQQTSGMAMGDSLSPFLCIYVNSLEGELAKNELFPRIWIRNVDDVFAIVKTEKFIIIDSLNLINDISPHIKCIMETDM